MHSGIIESENDKQNLGSRLLGRQWEEFGDLGRGHTWADFNHKLKIFS